MSLPLSIRVAISVLLGSSMIVLWLLVRPTETNSVTVNTVEDMEALIGTGKPVMIEFFSEY